MTCVESGTQWPLREAEHWKSRGGREPAQLFHLNVTGSPLAASDTLFTFPIHQLI